MSTPNTEGFLMALIVVTVLLLVVVPALILLLAKLASRATKRRLPFVSYPEDTPTAPKPGDTP
jgi:hypothetical protein